MRLKKWDNNQPRVPAGNPDGGQWTDGGGTSDYPDAIEEDHTIDTLVGIGGGIRAIGTRISKIFIEIILQHMAQKDLLKGVLQQSKRGKYLQ